MMQVFIFPYILTFKVPYLFYAIVAFVLEYALIYECSRIIGNKV